MAAFGEKNLKANFDGKILEQRIDYAKFLLTQTDAPLAAIADRCGWTSESAFAVVFQNRVGVPPAHYRNWHQC